MAEIFVSDPWLSKVVGQPCYALAHRASADAAALGEAATQLAGQGAAFFYAKVPTADVVRVAQLCRAGFTVVDTNVTLEFTGEKALFDAPADVLVTDAQAAHFAALQDIAARCFQFSRFHLDPLFPDATADLVKRKWIENYCLGARGAALHVALVDDVPAGFLAVIRTADAAPSAVIDLVGVAPEYQARGVGRALVAHFIDRWRAHATTLRVGTQVANIRSLSFYERCGFRTAASTYVLHAHYRNGAPIQ